MKLKFKVCDLTGAVESSGIIGDNNYNVALHDASFFGSNIRLGFDRGYKYTVFQNGFKTKESTEYHDLSELMNKDISFYIKF